jgi:DNA-binding transcriptional regulator GbsR (MarR family)
VTKRLDDAMDGVVEEFGLWFERSGLPRMAGRILGWLLVSDPPEQSLPDLAERLHASMGSVSTMTRMLEQIGLIERASVPGERRVRFRVRPHAFGRIWDDQLEKAQALQRIVDRALSQLDGTRPDLRDRLQTTRTFTSFFIDHLPPLIAEWNDVIGRHDDRPA